LLKSFFAYGTSFSGGVRVAGADVDGDGFAEIITAPGAGGGPHVRVINGRTGVDLYSFYALAPTFTGGLYVAAGDVTGDHRADIIVGTGADPSTDARIRVFDGVGLGVIRDTVVYTAFHGGVRVGSSDLNGDGIADIMTAPGAGASAAGPTAPPTLCLDGTNLNLIRSFNAYDPSFLGGVYVG